MSARISELPGWARLGLLAGLATLAVASLEFGSLARKGSRVFPPPLQRGIPPALTRFSLAAALGDEARIAADWGYIDCLQYLAGPYANDGWWGQTLPLYREVQWLDPGFKHAIREGISALGWLYRRPEEAGQLARIAMATDPGEVRYAAYIAALAYQKHLDTQGVIKALEPELNRPDAPEMLLRMVGNLMLKQGDDRRAMGYWAWVQSRAREQDTQDMAAKTIKDLRRRLAAGGR